MSEEKKQEDKKTIFSLKPSKTDPWLEKLSAYITASISSFVAFLFFVLTVGMIFGFIAVKRFPDISTWLILLPAILGLFAYYNRDFALFFFFLFLIAMFLF